MVRCHLINCCSGNQRGPRSQAIPEETPAPATLQGWSVAAVAIAGADFRRLANLIAVVVQVVERDQESRCFRASSKRHSSVLILIVKLGLAAWLAKRAWDRDCVVCAPVKTAGSVALLALRLMRIEFGKHGVIDTTADAGLLTEDDDLEWIFPVCGGSHRYRDESESELPPGTRVKHCKSNPNPLAVNP